MAPLLDYGGIEDFIPLLLVGTLGTGPRVINRKQSVPLDSILSV